MGHALLKKAILLLEMANVPFDLLIAVYSNAYIASLTDLGPIAQW